jgi:arylsulfatase A
MREPAIFRWPGRIEPGLVMDMGSTLDLFPTVLALAGVKGPDDRIMDGLDLSPTLFRQEPSPREIMFYYRGTKLYAVRKGPFKAHFFTKPEYGKTELVETQHDPPLLYNLEIDPSEKYNVAEDNPEVIADILEEAKRHQSDLVPGENQILKKLDQK